MLVQRHLFPVLAKRMPSFADNERHLESHHGIHEGEIRLPSPSFIARRGSVLLRRDERFSFRSLFFLLALISKTILMVPELISNGLPRCLGYSNLLGLDKLDELIRRWREDGTQYSPTEMRECLDSFR